jgi:hypothetical protein
VRYGIECEHFAKTKSEQLTGFKIQESVLFIYYHLPFLAASPDGLIDNNGIIEIKCPSTIKELTPKEAIESRKLKFATLDSQGNLQLKQSHNYYFQVMGQLKITQRLFCCFIIWSPKGNTQYLKRIVKFFFIFCLSLLQVYFIKKFLKMKNFSTQK